MSRKKESSNSEQKVRQAAVEGEIVKATIAWLHEGYTFADLSVGQITSRAGLSRSAFYDYFADKRALILRIALDISRQIDAEQWKSNNFQFPENLPQLLRSIIRLYTETGPELQAITEAANYDETMRRWWHNHLDLFINIVKDRIEIEQAAGKIVDVDAKASACALVWMVQQTCYQELVHSQRFSAEEVEKILTTLITRALFVTE